MSSWYEQAQEKLKQGAKKVKGQREGAMKGPVKETLLDFCRQNEEFAQAVAQGGSFPECMTAVAKGVGSSISDLEAYRKAVRFYFPQAEVRFAMTVETGTEPAETGTKAAKPAAIQPSGRPEAAIGLSGPEARPWTKPAPASDWKILDLTDFL